MKPVKIKLVLVTMSCFCIVSIITSCGSAGPKIAEQAVSTPDYRENRVLFVDNAENTNNNIRLLKHPYQLQENQDREIKKLSPLGCIIRGVRIPEELREPRDIAIVLDVVTAGSESVTSLVAFYQRNVPGGQMLNFQDLLVYYDPEWDGVTPPWFRVRILEVNAERNTRTKAFLDASNKLSGGLAGMVPHPVLPSVRTAVEAIDFDFFETKDRNGALRQGIKFFFKRENAIIYDIPEQLNLINEPQKQPFYKKPNRTEREGLVTSRVGQGAYRKSILHRWEYQCAATGFNNTNILIASHIHPWRNATDDERLDVDNGILLSPDYDALFDKHLISFENSGKIILATQLASSDYSKLGVNGKERIKDVSKGNKMYLEKHRAHMV